MDVKETFVKYQDVEISSSYLLRYDPCNNIIAWNNANSDVRNLLYSKVQEIEEFVKSKITCGSE